jgi:hypothetical protein
MSKTNQNGRTFKMRISSYAPVVVALGLMVGGNADAATKRVSVEAEVAAVKGDKAQTEKRAKREARRQAVEKGAGTVVESNTIVRNYQLVADEIVTKAKGVIVREEWGPLQMDGDIAKISLTADVNPEAIPAAICTVIKANHDPKIAIVMVEKSGKDGGDWKVERGLVEAIFTDRLMESCFTLVEPGVAVTEVSAKGDIPEKTIQEIIKNTDAQFIFVGQAKTIESDTAGQAIFKGNNMKSYSLSFSGRLLNVETKGIVASIGEHRQVLGISPEHALRYKKKEGARSFGIVDKVIDTLMQKVTKRWSSDLVNQASVSVVVQGVKNFKSARGFDKAVKSAFANAGLNRRSLKNGRATYDIEVEGGADEFAAGIEGKKVGKSTIEVLEVTRGKVVLKLK